MAVQEDARRGVVCVWNDIDNEIADEFDEWYQKDHLPDRVGTPGFRSSRRYVRVAGEGRQYLAFSELDTVAVGASPAYRSRLGNATEWTRRIMPHFRRAIRYVSEVTVDRGLGTGAYLGAVLYERLTADQMQTARLAIEVAFDEIMKDARVTRARIFEMSEEATGSGSNPEATLRPDPQRTADLSVVIEGLYEHTVANLIGRIAALPALERISQVMTPSVYRLLFSTRQ